MPKRAILITTPCSEITLATHWTLHLEYNGGNPSLSACLRGTSINSGRPTEYRLYLDRSYPICKLKSLYRYIQSSCTDRERFKPVYPNEREYLHLLPLYLNGEEVKRSEIPELLRLEVEYLQMKAKYGDFYRVHIARGSGKVWVGDLPSDTPDLETRLKERAMEMVSNLDRKSLVKILSSEG